ncbi:MAG: STAS-like domain-containing protein [Candidatus Moranbacteria bacterium]|nr:STAS-like domain-containing protein [Candidatus Moranbacteria bacterium]
MSYEIVLKDIVGDFAENKDLAREIRINKIIPALEKKEEVVLDFSGVNSVTQSFVHALISSLMRQYGDDVLEVISFKNCNETVSKIISIVVEYMQESV